MVVERKQTVASGVKNEPKTNEIDPLFVVTPQKPKKALKKSKKKKKISSSKKKKSIPKLSDTKKASQSQFLDIDDSDDIIKSHLNIIENTPLTKGMRTEKIAFAVFLALPERLRGSQGTFSKNWGISEQSLSGWKLDPDIQKVRMKIMKAVLLDRTPAVLDNLYNAASKPSMYGGGNTQAMKLWLQYVEDWQEASKLSLQAEGGFTINFGAGKSPFIAPEDEDPTIPVKE